MKFYVNHFEGGYQVFERSDDTDILIASFHRSARTKPGEKSLAQRRAEEYCDLLNQGGGSGDDFVLDFEKDP